MLIVPFHSRRMLLHREVTWTSKKQLKVHMSVDSIKLKVHVCSVDMFETPAGLRVFTTHSN